MRLLLINPSNPLVSIVHIRENRWNRYRVWKPLSLLTIAGLTPPEWEVQIVDENLGVPDYQGIAPPDLVGITASPPRPAAPARWPRTSSAGACLL